MTDLGLMYSTDWKRYKKNPDKSFLMFFCQDICLFCILSERGDSNARPLRPERSALPTALLSDLQFRI